MQGCVKVVLLDFDGTVVDTMKEYARLAAPLIAQALGISLEEAKRLYMETAGRSFRDQLTLLGVKEIEVYARKFEELKKPLLANLKLNPLVAERIKRLRDAGLKVYLSTNNECRVIEVNRHLTLLFDAVLCYDEEKGLRKGREHLMEVLRREGVSVEEVVFIGDSDYDVELYSGLGVHAIRTKGLWDPADNAVEEILRISRCKGSK